MPPASQASRVVMLGQKVQVSWLKLATAILMMVSVDESLKYDLAFLAVDQNQRSAS
jgi:hypothetical protein